MAGYPSEVTTAFWLSATVQRQDYPEHTERGGKWLVYVPEKELDAAWHKIVGALNNCELGTRAKAATALSNPNAYRDDVKVICVNAYRDDVKLICVYTYDGDDESDVMRVRSVLNDLGFTAPISWKADAATHAGQYANRGNRRICRYRV